MRLREYQHWLLGVVAVDPPELIRVGILRTPGITDSD